MSGKSMVKVFAFLVLSLLVTFTMSTYAAQDFKIVKVSKEPAIDGTVNPNEWSKAKVSEITADNAAQQWGVLPAGIKVTTYLMWNDNGLYGAAVAKDDKTIGKASLSNILARGDGVQLILDPTNKKSAVGPQDEVYIFDFYADEPCWYEHWIYGNESKNAMTTMPTDLGVEVKGKRTSDGWQLEFFLPWKAVGKLGEEFTVKEGTKMGFDFVVQDFDGNGQFHGYSMNAGWTPDKYDTMTLSGPAS